jgi:hypothetical protein
MITFPPAQIDSLAGVTVILISVRTFLSGHSILALTGKSFSIPSRSFYNLKLAIVLLFYAFGSTVLPGLSYACFFGLIIINVFFLSLNVFF